MAARWRLPKARGKGSTYMTGWTLFFTVVGITTMAAQLFRVIDFIEAPGKSK